MSSLNNNEKELSNIQSFAEVSSYVSNCLAIEDKIVKKINEEKIDIRKYVEQNKNSNEIELLNNFNATIDLCTIECNTVEPSNLSNTIYVSNWGDFVRLFLFKNLTEIYTYYGIDKENKIAKYFYSFIDANNNSYYIHLRKIQKLTKDEILKLYSKDEIMKYFTTEERKALQL